MMTTKKIFITGATSGIGLGIAQRLAKEGHSIGFNGLASPQEIEAIIAELQNLGAEKCHYFSGDMRHGDAIRAMMNDADRVFGGIDALVNNAGIQHVEKVENFPSERWDEVIAINLTACFHTTAVVLDGMRARGYGRIINIASVHGLIASANKTAYIAAKHGLVGLTKAVALETATDGITVNAICPGWVRTPLVESQIKARVKANGTTIEEEAIELVAERQPNKAFITPQQIGDMILFLLSDSAAGITGSALPVDGGFTAW